MLDNSTWWEVVRIQRIRISHHIWYFLWEIVRKPIGIYHFSPLLIIWASDRTPIHLIFSPSKAVARVCKFQNAHTKHSRMHPYCSKNFFLYVVIMPSIVKCCLYTLKPHILFLHSTCENSSLFCFCTSKRILTYKRRKKEHLAEPERSNYMKCWPTFSYVWGCWGF